MDLKTGAALGPDYSRLQIFVTIPGNAEMVQSFEMNFECIKNLKPGEEIRG
jgi:hypothetical protein